MSTTLTSQVTKTAPRSKAVKPSIVTSHPSSDSTLIRVENATGPFAIELFEAISRSFEVPQLDLGLFRGNLNVSTLNMMLQNLIDSYECGVCGRGFREVPYCACVKTVVLAVTPDLPPLDVIKRVGHQHSKVARSVTCVSTVSGASVAPSAASTKATSRGTGKSFKGFRNDSTFGSAVTASSADLSESASMIEGDSREDHVCSDLLHAMYDYRFALIEGPDFKDRDQAISELEKEIGRVWHLEDLERLHRYGDRFRKFCRTVDGVRGLVYTGRCPAEHHLCSKPSCATAYDLPPIRLYPGVSN